MKFLVDNQLPPALARMIQSEFQGDAAHVADIDLGSATDLQLWAYCSKTDSVLISKDDDFVRLVLNAPTARLVWVRVGNCRRGFILDVFRRVWPDIILRLEEQDRFIEIR